jgi:hypothetical protein
MGETERIPAMRPPPRRVRSGVSQDSVASGREARRIIEPLDESGAPLIGDTRADSRQLEDAIRLRAYERYLERQGRPGSAENDWLEAEREVRSTMWSARPRPETGNTGA